MAVLVRRCDQVLLPCDGHMVLDAVENEYQEDEHRPDNPLVRSLNGQALVKVVHPPEPKDDGNEMNEKIRPSDGRFQSTIFLGNFPFGDEHQVLAPTKVGVICIVNGGDE